MSRATSLFLLQAVAFWPVWNWYVARISDSSDEPWGVIALLTAFLFVATQKRTNTISTKALFLSGLISLIYILAFNTAPPLIRGVLAMSALSCTISGIYFGRFFHLGVTGLLVLSLPLIASLQFYAGYPVRLLTCHLSSAIISTIGTPVSPAGTSIHWLGEIVSIDAPCSGIRMLWSGLYLSFTLSCFFGFGHLRTWFTYCFANLAIFSGNVLRAVILFYIESGILAAPSWAHTGCGVVSFGLISISIFYFASRLSTAKGASI